MEPTEAQLEAAVAAFADSAGYLADHSPNIEAAVRAAFAAVPDPTELAEKWEDPDFSSRIMEDGYRSWFMYDATDYGKWLRAFMREGQ